MLSKNIIDDYSTRHELNHKEYLRIKEWLEMVHQNQCPSQPSDSTRDCVPVSYVFSFKKIHLIDSFISKNLRHLNTTASNGLNVLANVYDETKNYYLSKPYDKKGTSCTWDPISGVLELASENTLAFYLMKHRNITNIGQFLIVNFQLVSNEGSLFQLGNIKQSLSIQYKHSIADVEISKEGKKIGHIEVIIDTPQKLDLSPFLHPCCIVDQSTVIPPCSKLQLKNKVEPLVYSQAFLIKLCKLQMRVDNYHELVNWLHRTSPFFFEHHHDQTKCEVIGFQLLIGYHNSWKFVNLQKMKGRQKSKEPISQPSFHKGSKAEKMAIRESKEFFLQSNTKADLQILNLSLNLNKEGTVMSLCYPDDINLKHFEQEQGSLAAVLQISVKYRLKATISEEKVKSLNLFWVPIVFSGADRLSRIQIPMIRHIGFAGYMKPWNVQNDRIRAEIEYECLNQNIELQKMHKKEQKLQAFGSSKLMGVEKDHLFYQKLMDELKEGERKTSMKMKVQSQKLATNKSIKSEEVSRKLTGKIDFYLQQLNSKLKSRLVPTGQQITLPANKQAEQMPNRAEFISQSMQIEIQLNAYLPHTDDTENYYIPRRMEVRLYGFRHAYEQVFTFQKDDVKYGVPLQLHMQGTRSGPEPFTINIKQLSSEQYHRLQISNVICVVYDLQNYLFYGSGSFPCTRLFNKNQKEKYHFRIEIASNSTKSISGSFLLSSQCTFKQSRQRAVEEIKVESIIRELPMKERMLLRINNYNMKEGHHVNEDRKSDTIASHRNSHHNKLISKIVEQNYNIDIEIESEVGQAAYSWLNVINTDKSDNNIFTFRFDYDFMELVTDKAEYNKAAEKALRLSEGGKKNQSNLSFKFGDYQKKGEYSCKILSGGSVDLLIKVLRNEWIAKVQPTIVVFLQVDRNTLHYRSYKIKLTLKPALINFVHHTEVIEQLALNEFKITMPVYLTEQYGDSVLPFSKEAVFLKKSKEISFHQQSSSPVPEVGSTKQILVGFFWDKSFENLLVTVLLDIEIIQGEKIKVDFGSLLKLKVPYSCEKNQFQDKLYRIELSKSTCRQNSKQSSKIKYLNQREGFEPIVSLRCLQLGSQQIAMSIINYEGKLLKKYLVALECRLPPASHVEEYRVDGFQGQKVMLLLKNPYKIDYGFYLSSSTTAFIFHEVPFEEKETQSCLIKIASHCSIKITTEIGYELRKSEEYIVLSDMDHHVVTVIRLFKEKAGKNIYI